MGKFSDTIYPEHIQACIDGFKRDLPLILEGKDPHVYMADRAGWKNPVRGYKAPLRGILQACAYFYETSIDDIIKRKRTTNPMLAKKMYCYLAKTRTKKTNAQIRALIRIDQSSVSAHYKEMCEKMYSPYPEKRDGESLYAFNQITDILNRPGQYSEYGTKYLDHAILADSGS